METIRDNNFQVDNDLPRYPPTAYSTNLPRPTAAIHPFNLVFIIKLCLLLVRTSIRESGFRLLREANPDPDSVPQSNKIGH